MKKIYAFVILLTMGITNYAQAQCYQCEPDTKAFTIGTTTTATGNNSFAGGNLSIASSSNSFAFGYGSIVSGLRGIGLGYLSKVYQTDGIAIGSNAISDALNSYVFGQNISGSGNNSITIGLGTSSSSLLSNDKPSSLMFGVTHNPSLTIVKPNTNAPVGYLGINTVDPKQMIHINEGNLLITSVSSGASNAPAGALLFADVVNNMFPHGKWGIEYLNSNDPTYGGHGLNFRKYEGIFGAPSGSGASVLFLSNNDNIGVGTKNPQARLDIAGSFQAQNAAINGNILITNTSNPTTGLQKSAVIFDMVNQGTYQNKWGIERVNSRTEGDGLKFWKHTLIGDSLFGMSSSTTVMFFDNNDNVGIGTSDPQEKLDVNGSLKATNATFAGTVTANQLNVENFNFTTDSLGIGTKTPQERLHVANGNILLAKNSTATSSGSMMFKLNSSWEETWGIEYVNSSTTENGLSFWNYRYIAPNKDGDTTRGAQKRSVLFLTNSRDGRIGMGTTNPQANLDVSGSFKAESADISAISANTLTVQDATVNGSLSANSLTVPSITTTTLTAGNATITDLLKASEAQIIGTLNARNVIIENIASANTLNAQNANINEITSYTTGAGVAFAIIKKSATLEEEVFKIYGNGTVNAKKINAEEINVSVNAMISYPDYVFEDDYNLLPLNEVEQYIKENKRLPEIPSAKEAEENGIDLGSMQVKLLLKIEELTLYAIEQQKLIEDLQKQVKELHRSNKKGGK
jgi:hypothetical protein